MARQQTPKIQTPRIEISLGLSTTKFVAHACISTDMLTKQINPALKTCVCTRWLLEVLHSILKSMLLRAPSQASYLVGASLGIQICKYQWAPTGFQWATAKSWTHPPRATYYSYRVTWIKSSLYALKNMQIYQTNPSVCSISSLIEHH